MRESAYFRALQTTLKGAGLPYGYAVIVLAMGSVLTGEHGVATKAEIILFSVGVTSAYSGLKLLTWETAGEAEKPLGESPHPLRAGLIHLSAIAAAVAAALLLAQIPGSAAWLVTALVATLLYLGISSFEVAAVEGERGAPASGE